MTSDEVCRDLTASMYVVIFAHWYSSFNLSKELPKGAEMWFNYAH